jgi:hypothetical protein
MISRVVISRVAKLMIDQGKWSKLLGRQGWPTPGITLGLPSFVALANQKEGVL